MKVVSKVGLLTLFLLFFLVSQSFAFAPPPKKKVMLVGDSWAFFMHINGSVNAVLKERKLDDKWKQTALEFPGTTAEQWNDGFSGTAWKSALHANLATKPDVDVIMITLGGNDLINLFNTSLTEAEIESVYADVIEDFEEVVNHCLIFDKMRVAVMTYDYGNFDESLDNPVPLLDNQDRYDGLGQPDAEQTNTLLVRYGMLQQEYADSRGEKVKLINNSGLMHHNYGYEKHGIKPGETPHPASTLYDFDDVGGDITLWNTPDGMFDGWGIGGVDSIHLNTNGYKDIVRNAMDKCVEDWL